MNCKYFISLCLTVFVVFGHQAQAAKKKNKIDLVTLGKETFHANGCVECHATATDDNSFKTGPNLFGLFQKPAIPKKIQLASGEKAKVNADKQYFTRALTTPHAELALQKIGTEIGKAYYPIMPTFTWKNDDPRIKGLYAYLRTLNIEGKQGPAHIWVPAQKKRNKNYHVSTYDNQIRVGTQAVIARSPIKGTSTRTLHVGLPNKVNYSFDTVDLSIKKIWSGDFLQVTKERTGRGGGFNELASHSVDWKLDFILRPLTQSGEAIDLSFKNWPTLKGKDELERYYYQQLPNDIKQPYLELVEQAKGKFLGFNNQDKAKPTMQFRIEKNVIEQTVNITDDGLIILNFTVENPKENLKFALNIEHVTIIHQSAGHMNHNIWTVTRQDASNFTIQLKPKKLPTKPKTAQFAYSNKKQPLETIAFTKAELLPAGYTIESIKSPKDRFGRDQLFEPLAIEFAKNGVGVIGSRTAGIWKIIDNQWQFFAEGFHDPLGLHIEDDQANSIVIGQKPEITRVIDTDQDGIADVYQTINDDWRFAGNFSEFVHGPVTDGQGGYLFNLNLSTQGEKVGAKFMGSYGGYDGWMMHVNKTGKLTPWASGLRSPAGLGYGPDNQLLYTENQGSYVGTSKMFLVEKDDYYGTPASLVNTEKYRGKAIDWQEANKNKKLPVIYFPHAMVANSPGNPTFDTTEGKFGPFAGQILVGDQTLSNISRVNLQKVNDQWQGVVIPFISGLNSGVMRLAFAPDNSLWVGQTGRGWSAKGGAYEALQRVTWDGKAIPFEIENVRHVEAGFNVSFTGEVNLKNITADSFIIESWQYIDSPTYGSPRHFLKTHAVNAVQKENDKTLKIAVDDMVKDRIYQIKLIDIHAKSGQKPSNNLAYYTLHELL